MKNRREYITKY